VVNAIEWMVNKYTNNWNSTTNRTSL